jgi:hypothetical protein
VCIGDGDWRNQAGIKGHPSAPIKGLARALQKRATVVPMDEYKSSKLCSLCRDTMEKARLLTTNDDGEFELRKNRNVLRCANSAYRANFWDRDVNAARNILELLATRLMGLGRIAAFARGEAGLHATWVGRISIRNHTTRSFRSFEESEIASAKGFSSRWRNVKLLVVEVI